jgi:signal transduction histidine kinase
MSVRTKIFLLFAGGALLTVLPALLMIGRAVENRVYERATEELVNAIDALGTYWDREDDALQEAAWRIAREGRVAALLSSGDTAQLRTALAAQVSEGRSVLAADAAGNSLVGPALDSATVSGGGTVVIVSSADSAALRVAVWPVFAIAATPVAGDSSETMDEEGRPEEADGANGNDAAEAAAGDVATEGGGSASAVAEVEGVPVANATAEGALAESGVEADSVRIGIIGVGTRLDSRTIRDVKVITGGEVALVMGDSLIATTFPDTVAQGLQMLALPEMMRGGSIFGPFEVAGRPYLIGTSLLPTSGNEAMGILLFRSVAEELRIVRGIGQSMVGIGLFALVLALGLALLVARIVARPAQVLAAAATDVARGNFHTPLPPGSADEIGQLTRAFRDMRSAIAEREARLRSAQAELIHREKLAAMGRLVAQLSHEINNPIYNIQNCLEVLDRRGDPNDPNREFLDLAREELDRMAVLTRQLLDQSRPLADAARPLHLNHLVQRVATLARQNLEAHGIECEMRFDPSLPTVVAHPDAVQQVLANLVDNAIDAMPDGGTLSLRTRVDDDAVEVEVEDTGSGIAETDLPHIFEAFYTTKPGVRGIGLGLFVSEGIIRGHRGRLLVESQVGRGSKFTVQLPRETLDAALSSEEPGEPQTAATV